MSISVYDIEDTLTELMEEWDLEEEDAERVLDTMQYWGLEPQDIEEIDDEEGTLTTEYGVYQWGG